MLRSAARFRSKCFLAALFALLAITTIAQAQLIGRRGQVLCQQTCAMTYQTEYCAGDQPDDLQVHVTGKGFDTLEMYFRNEVYRQQIPNGTNLHCNQNIILARKNPLGTFAVRYGERTDRIIAFAWFLEPDGKPTPKPISTGELRPFPDEPVSMRWVSDRVLKIVPSCDQDRSLILRFTNEGGKNWQKFDAAANEWKSLTVPVTSH